MSAFQPKYRVRINKNFLAYPLFFDFLRVRFHSLIASAVLKSHLNLEEMYTFTVSEIPVQWGNYVIQKLRVMESVPEDKMDPKWKEISDILLSLNPLDPKPVDVSFKLGDIIIFVVNNVGHYQEITVGGPVDYFGINTDMWFNDYPISAGTVLMAVDFGTLDNYPNHVFDSVFADMRMHIMDMFTEYVNQFNDETVVM